MRNYTREVINSVLFGLYVNALVEGLSSIRVGCCVDGVSFNNLSNADNMVLLAPSIDAFHSFLHECELYGNSRGLVYNSKKTGNRCLTDVGVTVQRVFQFKGEFQQKIFVSFRCDFLISMISTYF